MLFVKYRLLGILRVRLISVMYADRLQPAGVCHPVATVAWQARPFSRRLFRKWPTALRFSGSAC